MRLLVRKMLGACSSVTLAATLVIAAGACGVAGETNADASGASTGSFITGAGGASSASSVSAGGDGGAGGQGGAGGEPSTGPYPFVLAHGFFGFEDFAGLGFETYYFGVKAHLAAQGETIATPAVDPFNSSEVRGQQLITRVEEFLALTGAKKVNLIGHSQGGLDARVVAHDRPDLVASVVTVATPHYGSPVSDVGLKLLADPNAQSVIDALVNLIGGPLFDQLGDTTSFSLALQQFSTEGITAFNEKYTDAPGVFYASVSGRSAYHLNDADCTGDVAIPFVTQWDQKIDPLDALFLVFSPLLAGNDNAAHDGLVRARDARWGEFWGCVPADHTDEVGQILGDLPGLANTWSHLEFYSQIIAHMRAKGY